VNKSLILGMSLALASGVAFAQYQGGAQGYQGGSGKGTQIQGTTNINAQAENTSAVAKGQGNTAKNTVGGIKGNTQIQGTTNINAKAKNTSAVASGKGNTAENAVGVVGGK
jgi:hypothetical protein